MWTQGMKRMGLNNYINMAKCASTKMKGGMWNDWGAQ